MRTPEEVVPIQSEAEFAQVLAEIRTLSGEAASKQRARRLLALKRRVESYYENRRQHIDPERLRALEELAALSQELNMGYRSRRRLSRGRIDQPHLLAPAVGPGPAQHLLHRKIGRPHQSLDDLGSQ